MLIIQTFKMRVCSCSECLATFALTLYSLCSSCEARAYQLTGEEGERLV
jgi:hypothetical protein